MVRLCVSQGVLSHDRCEILSVVRRRVEGLVVTVWVALKIVVIITLIVDAIVCIGPLLRLGIVTIGPLLWLRILIVV